MGRKFRNPTNPGLLLVVVFVAVSWWLAGRQNQNPPRTEAPAAANASGESETDGARPAERDSCEPPVVAEFSGRVVHVQDGDSFKLQTADRGTITVRMQSIDAPEKGQPAGDAARQNLKRLIEERDVGIRSVGQDRYERTLGFVILGGTELNEQLVREGWAWHYRQVSCERRFATAEQAARSARRGLWAADAPEPPWDFRRRKNAGR